MVRCAKCNAIIENSARFCGTCGAIVRRCAKCEAVLEPNARFCGSCGSAVAPTGTLAERVFAAIAAGKLFVTQEGAARRPAKAKRASPATVVSHWYKLIENLEASPREFYNSVEAAVQRRQIPNARTSRVDWREGGVFSALREYLRVARGRYVFDICGAPFGTGFFVSWWLAEPRSPWGPLALLILIIFTPGAVMGSFEAFGFFWGLLFVVIGLPILFWLFVKFMTKLREGWDDALVAMPFLGRLYERIFRPETYYRIDTTLMFQQAVHAAVLEVVDQMTSSKGIRALSELERKPILREFYRR